MHDQPLGPSNAIWDDGEWISWEYIDGLVTDGELKATFPESHIDLIRTFQDLVDAAQNYHAITGRYLQIWGELGEFYAEIKYGIKRHRAHAPGSDGRKGNDFIEVKTISPEKSGHDVRVKLAGNFNKLIVVRIYEDWAFDSKLIDRKLLGKSHAKFASVKWSEDEPKGNA